MFRVSKYSPEHMGRGWTQGCKDLREDSEKVDAWMNTIRRREQSAGGEWDPKIMSHFRLVDNCTGRVLRRVPIEPLASFLRHPRHHCFTPKPEEKSAAFSDNRFSPNYLVPLWRGEVEPAPEPPRRCFFFDIGARVYAPEHLGWFVDAYRARGVNFDRIFSWEKTISPPQEIFDAYPLQVLDIISYVNVPVDANNGSRYHPWRTLTAVARPDDFVVVKCASVRPRSPGPRPLRGARSNPTLTGWTLITRRWRRSWCVS